MNIRRNNHVGSAAALLVCMAVVLTGCDRMSKSTGGTTSATNDVSAARDSVYAEIAARAATGAVLCVESPDQFSFYVLTNTVPVLVLFHVPGSAPSGAMRDVAARIAAAYDKRLLVMGVDLTQEALRPLEAQYVVKSVPAMVFMRDGHEVFRVTGAQQYDEITPRIDQQMPASAKP